jgi:ribonuclease HI
LGAGHEGVTINEGRTSVNTELKHIELYTDGACSGNPGPGGWCAILRYDGHERVLRGGERQTTGNRMEMTAVIEGLFALQAPCQVTVFTDSQYVIGVMALGWKRKANRDLLLDLDALCAAHDVTFQHVRGHAGHPLNERCDRLACRERDRAKREAGGGS